MLLQEDSDDLYFEGGQTMRQFLDSLVHLRAAWLLTPSLISQIMIRSFSSSFHILAAAS